MARVQSNLALRNSFVTEDILISNRTFLSDPSRILTCIKESCFATGPGGSLSQAIMCAIDSLAGSVSTSTGKGHLFTYQQIETYNISSFEVTSLRFALDGARILGYAFEGHYSSPS